MYVCNAAARIRVFSINGVGDGIVQGQGARGGSICELYYCIEGIGLMLYP